MRYAQLDREGRVVGLSDLSRETESPHLIPCPDADEALMGKQWTGAAFVSVPAPEKPRVRVTATTTRIYELTPGQPPETDQVAILTAELIDETGKPDPSATFPETAVLLPSSGAGNREVLVLIRATAGVVEIRTRRGWSSTIPFATEHSGRYDIADLLRNHIEVVEAPVIEVLRG